MNVSNFSQQGLDKINEVNFLEKSDIDIITTLANELQDSFEKKEMFRTEFLARNSVLNSVKFPDPSSKFWQSVREQDSMFTSLVYSAIEYQKKIAEKEILECELDEISGITKKSKAQRKYKLAEIQEINFYILNKKLDAHHRVREIAMWEKFKIEQIKIDPSFDRDNPNTHQFDSFKKRWELEMNLGIKTNHADLYRNSKASLDTMSEQQ